MILANRWATVVNWVSLIAIATGLVVIIRCTPFHEMASIGMQRLEGLHPATALLVFALVYVVATLLLLPCWVLNMAAAVISATLGTWPHRPDNGPKRFIRAREADAWATASTSGPPRNGS
jgi:hypothetical protein